MSVILVRHAQALADADDAVRALSPAGKEAAERLARWLVRSGAKSPVEIRHSTLVRARQTAEHIGRAWNTPLVETPSLGPLDDVTGVARALMSETRDVVIVGHLPHLSRLAAALLVGDPRVEMIELPTTCALLMERVPASGARWWIRWVITPELIRDA